MQAGSIPARWPRSGEGRGSTPRLEKSLESAPLGMGRPFSANAEGVSIRVGNVRKSLITLLLDQDLMISKISPNSFWNLRR